MPTKKTDPVEEPEALEAVEADVPVEAPEPEAPVVKATRIETYMDADGFGWRAVSHSGETERSRGGFSDRDEALKSLREERDLDGLPVDQGGLSGWR